VLHWTFDADTGEKITDHSGRGRHGRLVSGELIDAPRGLALHGRAIVPDSAKLRHDGSYTLALWVYLPEFDGPVALVDKSSGANRGGRQYHLAVQGDDRRPMTAAGAQGQLVTASTSLPKETWTHLIVTYRYDGRHTHIRFYRDGRSMDAEVTAPGKTTSTPGELTISESGVHIDDLRLYHRALTEAQATALYRQDAMPRSRPQDPSLAAREPLWDEDSSESEDPEPTNAGNSSSFFGIPIK
jgi:hypothetical protein